jgi:large subunit ribosomal protein L4
LKKLGAGKTLIVDAKNETLSKSARNLPKAKVLASEGINVYDVLDHDTLVLTRATVDAVTARLKQVPKEVGGAS